MSTPGSPQVEASLLDHPAVAAAAVFGAPDPQWGERVVAALVLRPAAAAADAAAAACPPGGRVFGARAAPMGLHAHCVARLSGFKVKPGGIRSARQACSRDRHFHALRRFQSSFSCYRRFPLPPRERCDP